jgi:hypothetical protein
MMNRIPQILRARISEGSVKQDAEMGVLSSAEMFVSNYMLVSNSESHAA